MFHRLFALVCRRDLSGMGVHAICLQQKSEVVAMYNA
jgi:hypothetical protein